MKRSGLTRNPEAIRQWLDKHRGKGLKRNGLPRPPRSPGSGRSGAGGRKGPSPGLSRETPLRRSRPKPRWSPPAHVRAVALARSQGCCVACCVRAGLDPYTLSPAQAYVALKSLRIFQARELHHVLPRSKWPELTTDPDNLTGLCVKHHANHEAAFERIPAQAIPPCAARLALRTSQAAWHYLVSTYPRLPDPSE